MPLQASLLKGSLFGINPKLLNLGLIGNSVRVFYNNAEAAPATVDSNIHTFYTTEHKSVWEGYMNYKL